MATSVSASRCRTAWNDAIGLPNCTRSSACWRARVSIALAEPTSHQPSARRPAASRHPRRRLTWRIGSLIVDRGGRSRRLRSHTTQPPPAYGSGTVSPAPRPASISTTSLRTEACEPVSPSSRNTRGIAMSGMSASMSAQPSSASAVSSAGAGGRHMVLRSVSASMARSSAEMASTITPSRDPAAGAR